MQDKALHDKIQKHALEQKLFFAHGVHQNWTEFVKKNTKYSQIMANTQKDLILFGKSWTNMESGSRTKMFGKFEMNFANVLNWTQMLSHPRRFLFPGHYIP